MTKNDQQIGFSTYFFLVVWDYIKYARDNNISSIVQGSATGSLVVCAKITNGLILYIMDYYYSERFLNQAEINARY